MPALIALLLLVSSGAPGPLHREHDADRRFSRDAVAMLGRCGIPARRIHIRYETDLQDNEITLDRSAASPSDRQLKCVISAEVGHGFFIFFSDPIVRRRYRRLYDEIGRRMALAEARRWLQAHGLLSNLPRFDPARQSLDAFAQDLEAYCGIERGTMLTRFGGKVLTFKLEALHKFGFSEDRFGCLLHAISASGLHEHGLTVGFIGNGAYPSPPAGR